MHTLNPDKLSELKELDEDGSDTVLKELINLYLKTSPPKIKKLQELIEAKDFSSARKEAHSLRSSSLTMGAEILAQYASDIEYVKMGDEHLMSGSLVRVIEEYSQVSKLLLSHL